MKNVVKIAAWIPISREIDQELRPWLYPDYPRFPMIDPFPLVTRARRFAVKWCERFSGAWSSLCGRDEEVDDGWDGWDC